MAADTRERIITATNELFRRQGFNGTSLSQVSKAAPATIGSIYHFFPAGKEALAVAVIESTGAVYRQLFEAIVADCADPATAFTHFFDAAGQVLIETDFIDPCPIGTVVREAASTSEPIRCAADAAFDTWVDAAQHVLVRAGVRPDEACDLATLFVATVEGGFILSRSKRSVEPLRAIARSTVPLIASAISRDDSRATSV